MISSIDIDPKVKVREGSKLLRMPRIIRVQAFDEEATQVFAKDVSMAHRTGQPVIPIVIDSLGGDPYALWSMVETIKAAKIPIATIIEGKAMSCGAALFTCGAPGYRFIGPHSTLMIHDVRVDDVGGKVEDMKVEARETERLNKMMYAFMEENIGKPKGYLWRLTQKRSGADWYLTPKEAVRYGLASRVHIPTFTTKVTVEMTLE